MPGPSHRSVAEEFLRKKHERESQSAQMQSDYAQNLGHLRTLICQEKPVGDPQADPADWRSRIRRLLLSGIGRE
jgi:hypothetical protein